jgi:Mn-dependent DtxR family transcriptional regulator
MSSKGKHQRSPNARLQDRIILYLGRHDDVDTVAGLSRALGSYRSSTSRAINRLKTEGLVQKAEGRWILTNEGRKEEATLRQQLRERSNRANKEIERILRLQKEWERTIGSRAIRQVDWASRFMPKIPTVEIPNINTSPVPPALANLNSIIERQVALPKIAASIPFQVDYQLRPFFETLRLVDSVGVGNPAISSSLKAISESVQANKFAYMESISKTVASSFTPTNLNSLSTTLDIINRKLGEREFASVQVRAVEDLLKRIPSSVTFSDVFKDFTSQVKFASGGMVRQTLEQADASALLNEDVVSAAATDTLTDDPSASFEDAASALSKERAGSSELSAEINRRETLPAQTWDELSEVVKLRIVAVATFIVLYAAIMAAQDQGDSSEYVKDLGIALGATAAVVAICDKLELFKKEEK